MTFGMELSLIGPRIECLAIPKEYINDITIIRISNGAPIFRHLIQRKIEVQTKKHRYPQRAK